MKSKLPLIFLRPTMKLTNVTYVLFTEELPITIF